MKNDFGQQPQYSTHPVGHCEHPITVVDDATGEIQSVRCGSRLKRVCKSCSALAKKDYQKLIQGGFTDVDTSKFVFYFLTLTAPSFGKTHFVPKVGRPLRRCACGRRHDPVSDAGMRGAPLDFEQYDYRGCVRWNNLVGHLWDSTRAKLQVALPGFSYAKVYEFQERGALHLHAIFRVPVVERIEPDQLRDIARSTVRRDGMRWGEVADCQQIRQVADRDSFVRYMAKMLVYVTKDSTGEVSALSPMQRHHFWLLDKVAKTEFHCPRCGRMERPCLRLAHRRWGARSSVFSKSLGSRRHLPWTKLRRMGLKARRAEYARMMARAAVALKALQSMGHVAANMANGVNEIGRPMPLMV